MHNGSEALKVFCFISISSSKVAGLFSTRAWGLESLKAEPVAPGGDRTEITFTFALTTPSRLKTLRQTDRQNPRGLFQVWRRGLSADVWIDRLFPLRRERAVPMATRPAAAAGRYCEIRKTQTRKYLEGSRQLGNFLLAFIAT